MPKSRKPLSQQRGSASRTKRSKSFKKTYQLKFQQQNEDRMEVDAPKSTASDIPDVEYPHFQDTFVENEFESIMTEKMEIEKEILPNKIEGRRIIDINFFTRKTIEVTELHRKKCTSGSLFIDSETKCGFISTLKLKCDFCGRIFTIDTEGAKSKTVNEAVVWGTFSVGSTFKHTEEFFSILNIPCMSSTFFYKTQENLRPIWSDSYMNTMNKAGEEERSYAIENGHVDNDGVPWVTVYLDGGWSKRSYGHNYNAASGLAVIIGKHSKKVLYMGVRNKFCIICAKAANKNENPKQHKCFKNWEGSSSAMESDIIVEGFNSSIDQHGVKYKKFIADGDSSVYAKIQQHVSYGKEVMKVECTNHIIKNYGKRLHIIKSDTKSIGLQSRKLLTTNKIKALQQIAQKAIYDNAHGDVGTLIEDISNGPNHIFDNHVKCRDYYCSEIGVVNENIKNKLSATGLLRLIQSALNPVIRKANCLIDNESNNRAELFMSLVCRFNMGKRLNLIQRGSFAARAQLACMRYNEGFMWHSQPWKDLTKESPGQHLKRYISRQESYKRKLNYYIRSNKKRPVALPKHDKDYGPNALEPNLNEDEVYEQCERFLSNLDITRDKQLQIAESTIGQFDNPVYRLERKDKLTASNFGKVIRRKDATPCHNLVVQILNTKSFSTSATDYGKMNESLAIQLFEEKTNLKVRPSGLFIDLLHPYLAASPDGLIGTDELIEVKCLYKVAKLNIDLEEAAKKLRICLKYEENKLRLKRNHDYYYQVQGQLHITGRKKCYFVVFISNSQPLYVEEIVKDDDFWYNEMLEKLRRFYEYCVLPEIVRGNIKRGLKCRDPPYILDAQEKKIKK